MIEAKGELCVGVSSVSSVHGSDEELSYNQGVV